MLSHEITGHDTDIDSNLRKTHNWKLAHLCVLCLTQSFRVYSLGTSPVGFENMCLVYVLTERCREIERYFANL